MRGVTSAYPSRKRRRRWIDLPIRPFRRRPRFCHRIKWRNGRRDRGDRHRSSHASHATSPTLNSTTFLFKQRGKWGKWGKRGHGTVSVGNTRRRTKTLVSPFISIRGRKRRTCKIWSLSSLTSAWNAPWSPSPVTLSVKNPADVSLISTFLKILHTRDKLELP